MPTTDLSPGDDIIRTTTTSLNTLPPEWRLTTIGEQFDVQQGKALSPAVRSGRSYRPFLRTSNVLWGRLDLTAVDQMDFTEDEANRLALRSGDLLVCEGGEVGRTAIWHQEIPDCLFQNHLHRLRAKTPHVHPEFVMYWMQAALLHLGLYGGIANKTTIPNLSGGRLKNLSIPLPMLSEQQAIANVLTKIRSALQVQGMTIAKLKELKAATIAKLFREGLRGEPLKQTEIGEIPVSWQLVPIETLGTLITGTTPPTEHREYYDGGVPFISPADITDMRVIDHTEKTLSRAGLAVARPLPPKSVLIVCIGSTIGKVGMTIHPSSCTNQQINAIVCSEPFCPEFAHYLMVAQADRIRALSSPGPVPILNKGAFGKILVPVPNDKSDQDQIAGVLSAIDDSLLAAQRAATSGGTIFSALLKLLLSGDIRMVGFVSAHQSAVRGIPTS